MSQIVLRLYVTGNTPTAAQAISTLKALCNELGEDRVSMDVIDVLEDPESALNDDVYATPTVFRIKPDPIRRVFGNLSSAEMLIVALQLSLHEEDA